uniref:Ig-like domain-containing protein n=1 Tax=Oreochromis niloticus TaxID=8128 RepID=A0A669CVG3_ORENI
MDCMQQMDGLLLQKSHRIITALFFFILLHCCRGQSQLFGPSQPIVARVGDDITLPCHLKPAMDITAKTLEWTRSDLDPIFVFVWRARQEFEKTKHPSYKERSSLSADELRHGNMSLKLSSVNVSDKGTYKCYIVEMDKEFYINLVVASDIGSSPVLSLAGTDVEKGEVTLKCESAAWYPEPELLWLDGEGNLLYAGPTETLRGPDGLYTVSSRVTVEKRHSNNITCRVQQRNTKQSKEIHIYVPDEFFMFTPSSANPINIGLAVSLAVSIMLIIIGVFFVWRQNKKNVKSAHCDGCKEQETRNHSKRDKTETDQEQEKLMRQNISPMEKKQEAIMNFEESTEELKHQLKKKEAEIIELKKQTENQHAVGEKWKNANEKLKEAHRQLEEKNAEISNMKKEEEKQEADKKLRGDDKQDFQQEKKQADDTKNVDQQQAGKPNKPQTGDITLDEVDRSGDYICLKNASSENKVMTGWELKLQINDNEPLTHKFKENFTMKPGEIVTVRRDGARNPYPTNADLRWIYMKSWKPEDTLKIDLISSTGKKHRLN